MKRITLIALTIGIFLVLSSCQTTPVYEVQGDLVQNFSEDGVTVKAEFLPESELKRRFGDRNNPFLSPQFKLMPERYLVFEVTVVAEDAPAQMVLNQVELQFGKATSQPMNDFQFTGFWESQPTTEDLPTAQKRSAEALIRKNLPPNKYTIEEGQRETYLFLFRGNFPKFGEADLYLPILGPDERPKARAEFRYEF